MKCFWGKIALGVMSVLLSAAGAGAQSSVWAVKGAGATVYLAGSCHVLRASDHPLPAPFETAYADSRQLIFEAPPGDLEAAEYLQKLMALAMYPDGTTLKQHVAPAVYARAEKFCRERGYPFDQYQMFRPWMLSMMLAMQELSRLGVEARYGVDHFYYQKALRDGKSIGGLETADEQVGFLAAMDGSVGNEQLSETIDDLTRLDGKIEDILAAWRRGDEAGIEAVMLRELKNYPQLYVLLIVNRNQKWLAKIESALGGNINTMVIVGVAHLAGRDSVVDLLRRRGFKVTQLSR
ncbi:MAG: TraB/GumN family protein [Deltaproteobacteria bacterium]|nr:TraB/GumN family protein [Deltaproteobacteria bacterium]